jgi:hypothetical protein
VFTNLATGSRPPRVLLTTGNAAALQPAMASGLSVADTETLIGRVLAGRREGDVYVARLGGVDRSTMAVIESSPLAGGDRPTMIYAGALDGMLHAFCAEAVAPCVARGQELWAYVPRTQLPALRQNTQRIDGSPKVLDVFGDYDADGTKEWRTVLAFQTGSGAADDAAQAPAVVALDVTDPGSPAILWEVATPTARGAVDHGIGLGIAMGPVRSGAAVRNLVLAQTNNGGTGGAGMYLAAIDTVTGAVVWTFGHEYPAPRDPANPPVPATGIPGGVAAVDVDRTGALTRVVVPTLYGDAWLLDAATGANVYGTLPLFRFTGDFHPIGAAPSIYEDQSSGQLHAVLVSGGYTDPVQTSWSPDDVTQFAVSVSLDAPAGVVPLDDGADDASGARAFLIDLGTGARAFAQATVAGNELFVATDSADVNLDTYGTTGSTGGIGRYSLSTGAQIGTRTTVSGGAASVDVDHQGVVSSGAGTAAARVDFSEDFDETGETVELVFKTKRGRQLWLRTE